jgi:hypothetical protein
MKSYDCPKSDYVLINSQELSALIEGGKDPVRERSEAFPQLNHVWSFLLKTFAPTAEPQIYQKRDRSGNTYFKVYDPVTHRSNVFKTEQEVRVWLDQRHYQ